MTGIYINGASGKMGVNLLERIHLNNDIQICKTIDEDLLDTIIE
jgi:dihydrodipicolinate reductase